MSHEALFDSGSDIHCMFGGDQIETRLQKESLQRLTGCCLSLSGWGKTHQQIQLFQEEDDHLLSARHELLEIAGIPTGSQHVQSSGVKQSADASIGISLAVNSGFRAGHNLASSWRACA